MGLEEAARELATAVANSAVGCSGGAETVLEVTVVADSAAVEREAVVTEVNWEAVEKAAAAMVAATAVEVQVADMEGSVDVERYD